MDLDFNLNFNCFFYQTLGEDLGRDRGEAEARPRQWFLDRGEARSIFRIGLGHLYQTLPQLGLGEGLCSSNNLVAFFYFLNVLSIIMLL